MFTSSHLSIILCYLILIVCEISIDDDIVLQYQYDITVDTETKQVILITLYKSDNIIDKINKICIDYDISNCDSLQNDIQIQLNKFILPTHTAQVTSVVNIIWILWYQGWNNAPAIVKKCLQSWQYHHSVYNYNIILLDKYNIPQFIDLSDVIPSEVVREEVSRAALSDVVRWMLLYKYGGIWVDSTLYCHRPLHTWINLTYDSHSSSPHYTTDTSGHNYDSCTNVICSNNTSPFSSPTINMTSNSDTSTDINTITTTINNDFTYTGFYAIHNPRIYNPNLRIQNNRYIHLYYANFLLISTKGNYITKRMTETLKNYWLYRPKEHFYYYINLLFEELYHTDNIFKLLWDSVDSRDSVFYHNIHYIQRNFHTILSHIPIVHTPVPESTAVPVSVSVYDVDRSGEGERENMSGVEKREDMSGVEKGETETVVYWRNWLCHPPVYVSKLTYKNTPIYNSTDNSTDDISYITVYDMASRPG